MMDRMTHLLTVLRKARDTFQEYGDNHMAKMPPQRDKARRNYLMVDEINQALLADDPPSDLTLFEKMTTISGQRREGETVQG
jgi:hypothetical protein